jgi:hypothetical protein
MNATDDFAVTMTAGEWNQVLAILGEGPFRVVAPLIARIRDQVMAGANGGAGPPQSAGAPHDPAGVARVSD